MPEMYVCKSRTPSEVSDPSDPGALLRAGGLVDVARGVYLAPSDAAQWDQSFGLFIYDRKDVTFDSASGQIQNHETTPTTPSLLDSSSKADNKPK